MKKSDGVTYIHVPEHLLAVGLRSAHELVLLGLAVGFNGTGIRMSNAGLARLLRTDRRHVPRLIGRLVARGYLRIEEQNGRRIIHPTDTILVSPPDTKLVTEGHQNGDKVTPEVPCPSITEGTEIELKGAKGRPSSPSSKAGQVAAVLDCWNTYTGRSIDKSDPDTGQTIHVHWHGYKPGPDGMVRQDVDAAIRRALEGFNIEDVRGTVQNYAAVLLSDDTFWTYAWSVAEFFTRREGRAKTDGFKWWRFLPGTFDIEKYRCRRQTSEGLNLDGSSEEEVLAAFGE